MAGKRTSLRVVLVTAPSRRARSLARRLVDRRVAACANVVPGVKSIYRWKGKVEEAGESLLILKTTTSKVKQLEKAVVELHPYDVPEVVVLPVDHALAAYADWVREETS
ncbi:MAG: divalent-cation tolerance protein CutA [Planctomycetota bacterium]|jgi:periplasmic divalent cation tolerance protein